LPLLKFQPSYIGRRSTGQWWMGGFYSKL